MNKEFGLPCEDVLRIRKALFQFPLVNKATLYGSRVRGNYRPGSDIDLTLDISPEWTTSEKSYEAYKLLLDVSGVLDDLNLPWLFDISFHHQIDNPNLLDHIQRVGVEFYTPAAFAAQQENAEKKKQYSQAATQSEAQLEENLIKRLTGLGYDRVAITSIDELKANLKTQLEKHNKVELTEGEFRKVVNHLDQGSVFERAKTLRDKMQLTRDDGSSLYLEFLNTEHWCQNEYQVTHQVTVEGTYKNRYDVTLLINGLPLVQIELKRRGMELKEAFNQINRYQRHSFWAESGLFQYVQLFVISNGVNTKYYANNRKQSFKQTFFWTDKDNNKTTDLELFADEFLEKCHLSKMISQYIVLHESDKILMVLRPYQYYAVEAIVDRVENTRKFGYIWHTTGSGKTLTSFKAAQILTALPKVDKVVFVVDRADLDYQTTREFNHFSKGSVDGTVNTRSLVRQIAGDNGLIVTTLQKLNTAIKKTKHQAAMEALRDKRIVFIFDECHRSQFGDTHKNIVNFFTGAQMFGFTGTPIFKENATINEHGKRTTDDLFEKALHKYVITNAIADDNVLKFSIEYWGQFVQKSDSGTGECFDEKVTGINTKEVFDDPVRIEKNVDWIIENHHRKTHNKSFSAMLCVSSVDALIAYYETFRRKREAGMHDLRVVTIFTYGTNEDDADANGLIGDPDFEAFDNKNRQGGENKHSREKLEAFIADYNALYKTSHSARDSSAFYAYYKDIAKRMKERDRETFQDKDRADILLVVNMFLTGFDAKKLNTLYVDKNLKYHGLLQAYSRTNRTLSELKSQGNIVCFRPLKKNTDDAIQLFSNTDADGTIFVEPYDRYTELFNQGVLELMVIAPTPQDVDALISEDDQLKFVRAFRKLIRMLNVLKSFTEFNFVDLDLDEQTFEDYKSKYLDIYDRTRSDREAGVSIIDEVDFELELIQRDEINVTYILRLLADLQGSKDASSKEFEQKKKGIIDLMNNEVQLRSKRELIEKFINDCMPDLTAEDEIEEVFDRFWSEERKQAVKGLCSAENLNQHALYQMMEDYQFTGKEPLRERVFSALSVKPKLLERKAIFERIVGRFKEIIRIFDEDIGDLP
ncbi:HsdR family type I site-specific deoxyribonuclease [Endozoicomonas sp. SESOKO2]|uniref:type I restriction endonuclease subunit R, EcoR124 family n=2 Tax=unclassified Endozoicomonas TaxID=2644528 RepID=UPI0021498D08|nr:HsdR family type I site-specific deoxyribonuclease [Endozoicomonas sp. SESOKO2]